MQVACPSCSAEYPVDERRLPAAGLKMRCPKCGARFHVHPGGRVEASDAAAPPRPAVPKPPGVPSPARKLVGGMGSVDLPAPKGAVPKPPRPKIAPPVAEGDLDLDLPAPRGAAPPPPKPAAPELDLDLPAPRTAASPARRFAPAKKDDLDLDLPAPRAAPPPPKPTAKPSPTAPTRPAPKPAAKPPARPPPSTPLDDLDLDLPAPRAGGAPSADIDLPAPRQAAPKARIAPPLAPSQLSTPFASAPGRDASAARAAADADPLGDLGLAPVAAGGDFDLDLPAPRGAPARPPASPRPALADAGTPFDDLDLPAPRGEQHELSGADLPALRQEGNVDLPAVRGDFGGVDLPRTRRKSVIEDAEEAFGDLDLPMPKASGGGGFGDIDLPVPKAQSDLPAPKADAFGDLELPTPRSDPAARPFDDLDLPTPREVSDLPVAAENADLPIARDVGGFDDLALPEPRSGEVPIEFDEPPEADHGMRDPEGRSGLGGVAFGELDLGEQPAGDDMEFADIPEESEPSARDSLPPPRVAARKSPAKAKSVGPKPKGRGILYAVVILVLIMGTGIGLAFTPYGLFGMNLIQPFLPGAGDPAQVRAVITRAEEQAVTDRWEDVRTSLVTLGEARANAGLNQTLLSRSLLHEALYQVRFGDGFGSTERTARLLQRIEERGMDGPDVALGRAAERLRAGDLAAARANVAQARGGAADDPYVDLVLGEIELAEGATEPALTAFQASAEHGGGARALWGVARATLRTDDAEASRAAVEAVLAASPHHVDALAAKAQLLEDAGELDAAYTLARQAAGADPFEGEELRGSPRARASALTLVGRIEEGHGRSSAALAAYDAALAAVDNYVPAFLGAGRVLLGDRPADALARFESVLQAEGAEQIHLPNGRTGRQEAQLGVARAQLALDRIQDANTTLEALLAELPQDADVLLWMGKASEALDPPQYARAEGHYREAITQAPQRFGAYLALAELFLATDRGDDAGAFLDRAETEVPETAEMRYQLGAFELRRNRIADAIRELRRALELNPTHPPTLFSLAVAYRRSGQLDAAARTFDTLAEIDAGHPGLSLERGLLFEARGESDRAADSYEAALGSNPDDLDLLLRLGAAQVAAGRIDDAEVTLDRVRAGRPNSSEANHFVGRVSFARGNFAEALTYFRRAVQLDPSRGEFHLYVGWAALENGQLGEALHAVNDALERDPSLGDAYWIRGVVKLRSGRPRDALADLTRALELKPSRHEAEAAMGDAYDQLGELDDAIQSYARAVAAVDDNGEWWYRLGRLRMDRGQRGDAAVALQRATLLGDAMTPLPGWLADAHRLRGDALRLGGQGHEAVPHYRRYLELAPPSAIDRRQVREALMDLGEVP
ncbi:MAG: tetratricopeptide repeat protein [Sandaracinaceae bacterium]